MPGLIGAAVQGFVFAPLRDGMLALLRALGLGLLERPRLAPLIDIGSHGSGRGGAFDWGTRRAGGEQRDAGQDHPFHTAQPFLSAAPRPCCRISVTPRRDEPVAGEDGSAAAPLTPPGPQASHMHGNNPGREA
jgi:hypothetical protein